jgi:hypothetical protein
MTKNEEICVVAVDLGQTNPIAAGIFRVRQDTGKMVAVRMGGESYWWGLHHEPWETGRPGTILDAVRAYRTRCDAHEARLDQAALETLSPEHQVIYREFQGDLCERTRQLVCEHLGLDSTSLPWDRMDGRSVFISSAYQATGGDIGNVTFTHDPKSKRCEDKACKHALSNHTEKGCLVNECSCKRPHKTRKAKPKTEIRSDRNWAQHLRPRLPKPVRDAFSEARWRIQQTDPIYQRLAKESKELVRRAVNALLKKARDLSQCALVIEDLKALNQFFSGKGKRLPGWAGYFIRKRENRWFVRACHKALSSLPSDKGMLVMEVGPAWSSQTCPACRVTDRQSRDGERFVCTACKRAFHADGEVATFNLLTIALTGVGIPRPPDERSGDSAAPKGARKGSKPRKPKENAADLDVQATVDALSPDHRSQAGV